MPNSVEDEELEEGELDDEGECDDVTPADESANSERGKRVSRMLMYVFKHQFISCVNPCA
jgi:hypothetical protein